MAPPKLKLKLKLCDRKVPWKSRKIEIKYIEDKNYRRVTFSKRRKGLISMAQRLGLEFAVIAISDAGTPYADGDMSLIDRFLPMIVQQQPSIPVVADDIVTYINQALGADHDEENMSEALKAKIQDEMDSLTRHIDHRLNAQQQQPPIPIPIPIVVQQPMVVDDDDIVAYINQTLGADDDVENMSEALRAKIQDEMDSLMRQIDDTLQTSQC